MPATGRAARAVVAGVSHIKDEIMRVYFVLIVISLFSNLANADQDFKTYTLAGISLTGKLDFLSIKDTFGNVNTYRSDDHKVQSNVCYYSKNKSTVFIFSKSNMGHGFIIRKPIGADTKRCGFSEEIDVYVKGIRLGITHDEYLKQIDIPIRVDAADRVEHVYADKAQLTDSEIKEMYKESFQDMKWDDFLDLLNYAGEIVDIQANFENSLLSKVRIWYSIQF